MDTATLNFSEGLLNLGKLHWYLLHADRTMEAKALVQHPPGEIHQPTWTEFGRQVENDEINWWVFKREHDLPLLRLKTSTSLEAAQILKEASQKLNKRFFYSLNNLYKAYESFAKQYEKEISIVLEFAQWLHQRDEMDPTILFNYRTWGSTRISNRIIEISSDSSDAQSRKKLALIVLGLAKGETQGEKLTIETVRLEIQSELAEMVDPENYANANLEVRHNELVVRTANEATECFAEYFEQLRDSLRNVMLDIEQRETQDRLFSSDDFWRLFISKAARSAKTEQKYWDLKQTLDMWQNKKGPEKSKRENKFAEIVAGFANNQGGVIIVGVTDNAPRQIVGLSGTSREIENYMKHTRNVISKYIQYERDFVHFQQVNVPNQNGDYRLCLVIVIQQTSHGLSVTGLDGKSFSYPFREETGLVWKEPHQIRDKKIGIKSDNYHFLTVLQQFVNEEI